MKHLIRLCTVLCTALWAYSVQAQELDLRDSTRYLALIDSSFNAVTLRHSSVSPIMRRHALTEQGSTHLRVSIMRLLLIIHC